MTEQQTLPPSSAPIFDTASWDALTSDGASADEVRIMVAVLTGRPLQTLRSEAYVGTPALPHQMLGQLFDTLGTPNNIAILGEVVAAGGTKNAFFAHMLDEEFADFDASGFRTRFVKKSHPSVASRIVSMAAEEVERARQAEAAAAAAEVERVRHAAEAAAAAAAEAEQRVRQAEAAAAAEEAERARLAEEADAAEKLRASTAAAGGVADTKSPEGDGHDEKSTEISSSHDDFGDFMTKQTGNESVGGKHDKLLAAEAAKLLQAEKERAAKKEADDDDVMQDTSDGIWMTKTVAGGTAPAAAAAAAPPVPPTSGLDVVEEATSPTRSSGAATKVEDGVIPPPDGEAGYPMTMDSYVDEDGEIGRGAFAKVILCKVKGREIVQDDGTMGLERVAIKKIEADTQDMDLIQKEVDMMKLCRNRNMLKTHKNFLDGTTLYIVMPVMDYGSMHDVVKELEARGTYAHGGESLKEEWVSIVIYKAICGLMYLHDKGYVHRDIKAANILLGADGEIKLCDYGVASMVYSEGCQTDTCETFVGTPCWMAPELMRQNIPYAQKADMWSIGITALELAKGYAPYERERPMKIILMTLSQAAPTLDTYEVSSCADCSCSFYVSRLSVFSAPMPSSLLLLLLRLLLYAHPLHTRSHLPLPSLLLLLLIVTHRHRITRGKAPRGRSSRSQQRSSALPSGIF